MAISRPKQVAFVALALAVSIWVVPAPAHAGVNLGSALVVRARLDVAA